MPDLRPAPSLRSVAGPWQLPVKKPSSLLSSSRFRFLNEEHDALTQFDWNHPGWSRLWLYNLHYFDDLNANECQDRRRWHEALIERWINENKAGHGVGWDSYPISLRVVNWIKWGLAGNLLSPSALHSLAVQVRFLRKRLEYHLPGNHLLANAKALIFAGCFFSGREADEWLDRGFRILKAELPIQVLPDGGHFELSPMYHSIVLEDLLDLINVSASYAVSINIDGLREAIPRMLSWLSIMTHPDGQIALFNDSAFGIASSPSVLYDYARRLGFERADRESVPGTDRLQFGTTMITVLKPSGYIRVDDGPMTAILDAACVGPDYLPGHGHADTLTFEVSLYNQRLIVNGGTSVYSEDMERHTQRGTAAHNTVVVDGMDSSEIWGGFRVARRARTFGLSVKQLLSSETSVECAHDGYKRLSGKAIHWREWRIANHSMTINDRVDGGYSQAVSFIHFAPTVLVEATGKAVCMHLENGQNVFCRIDQGDVRMTETLYHPEFGVSLPNQCLQLNLRGNRSSVIISW